MEHETYPKNLISEALLMAQKAVALDSANDVPEALLAYTDACEMLSLVLSSNEIRADRQKLSQIHSTYIERIYLLNKLEAPSVTGLNEEILAAKNKNGVAQMYEPTDELPLHSPTSNPLISERAFTYHNEALQRITSPDPGNIHWLHRDSNDQLPSKASVTKLDSSYTQNLYADRANNQANAIQDSDLRVRDHNYSAAGSDEDDSLAGNNTLPRSPLKMQRVVSYSEDNVPLSSPKQHLPLMPKHISSMEDVASEPRDFSFSRTFMKSASAVAASYRRPSLNMQNLTRARSNTSTKADRLSIERGYSRSRSSSLMPNAARRSIYHSFDFRQRKFEDDVSEPPGEILLRPYWLMKILQKTLTRSDAVETGTFLSRELFIPGDTWLLSNCKIRAEDEKMKCYQLLIESLQNIIDSRAGDVVILLQSLDGLTKAMDAAQSLLTKKLGIELLTCPNLPPHSGETTTTTRARVNGKSINRLLGRKASRETFVESSDVFEGPHAVFQHALSQVFEMSQIMGKCI